jgi:O-succinylbenzoate synthase
MWRTYAPFVKRSGPDAPLMADANNAYQLADAENLAKLDDLGLMMIEQPLAWDDIVQHASLQKQLKTPLCLDESITSLDRARDMVTLDAGRIINIKPGRVGGFASSLAIHDYCQSNDIPVWCGGMLETGIGRACNVALASLPGFTKPGDLSPSARYWERDVVTPGVDRCRPTEWCECRWIVRDSASTWMSIASTISRCAREFSGSSTQPVIA